MDISAANAVASSGASQGAISLSLMNSTKNLEQTQVSILMASLGVGASVDALG